MRHLPPVAEALLREILAPDDFDTVSTFLGVGLLLLAAFERSDNS